MFSTHTRKIEKAWSILWCNVSASPCMWLEITFTCTQGSIDAPILSRLSLPTVFSCEFMLIVFFLSKRHIQLLLICVCTYTSLNNGCYTWTYHIILNDGWFHASDMVSDSYFKNTTHNTFSNESTKVYAKPRRNMSVLWASQHWSIRPWWWACR